MSKRQTKLGGSNQGAAVAARPRKKHSKRDAIRFPVRFGLHLRSLMDQRNWQTADLQKALEAEGVEIGKPTIQKWLAGRGTPREEFYEPLGRALGLADYREVLPPKKS